MYAIEVYLRSSPQVVYNRMLQRNRPEESGVSLEYLTDLHQHYEAWLMEGDPASLPAPVLVLDVDQDLQQVTQMYARLQQCLLERRSINKGRFQISLRGDQLCF
ncbi:deoxynucleoside kinase-like [Nilaparvata lugens]|uniref:deoxynucleoside kinase-like n=1 Tax=Nilaparvata lugens TaxID=108931 RepID=UPI00193D2F92|nr:deoxynucleoside kinase-like [Nilaparvata lugens]